MESDQLGSPRLISNQAKQTVWQWRSEPFGSAQPNANPSNLGEFTYNLRFPGQYYDRESGLHYNYYRDYDPKSGRYIQSDPIGLEGGVNTYAYVNSNPQMSADSLGLAMDSVSRTCSMNPALCVSAGILTGAAVHQSSSSDDDTGKSLDIPLPNINFPDPCQLLPELCGSEQQQQSEQQQEKQKLIDECNEFWGEGGRGSPYKNFMHHYEKHKVRVGATTPRQYMDKALQFTTRGAKNRPQPGYTDNVTHYVKNGRYIDKDAQGKIISYGSDAPW